MQVDQGGRAHRGGWKAESEGLEAGQLDGTFALVQQGQQEMLAHPLAAARQDGERDNDGEGQRKEDAHVVRPIVGSPGRVKR